MPKTDDGFQGWRPHSYGDIWDKMDSPERRQAFWSDIWICGILVFLIWVSQWF